jgi:hypothetical protein
MKPDNDYFSSSTIDNPPREPKQKQIPGAEQSDEETEDFLAENGPLRVKYSLALTLKSDAGDTVIKFGPYQAFPEQLEDHLSRQFNSKYFRARIKAAVALTVEEDTEN